MTADLQRPTQDLELQSLLWELREIRQEMVTSVRDVDVPPHLGGSRGKSLRNLSHYLALRRRDIRPLQERLARAGLSSLGRCESHVLSSVDAVLHVLSRATGESVPPPAGSDAPSFEEGPAILSERSEALLGPSPEHRTTRIMVTMSPEMAADDSLLHRLFASGMDAVRVNCGHDDADAWKAMINRVRSAARRAERSCVVHVDLAGPKIRTSGIVDPLSLESGDGLVLVKRVAGTALIDGLPCVECTLPEALDGVQVGHRVWFDDGTLGGVVERLVEGGVVVRIDHARGGRRRLGSDRGVNFPESSVDVSGFTDKDREDLRAIAPHADTVALSFAQRPDDVQALLAELEACGRGAMGIVLKIETRDGFVALPRLLLNHTGPQPLGVMIARGDLAIEIGYERLAEVQEEMLWICEAAHVPVIWATQVLESLSKEGQPTRAEVTDAAMASGAECVMLNKGKHVVDSVTVLDDILARMQQHQRKKSPTFRALRVSRF
jgi:pyruvate kinase